MPRFKIKEKGTSNQWFRTRPTKVEAIEALLKDKPYLDISKLITTEEIKTFEGCMPGCGHSGRGCSRDDCPMW